MSKRAEAILKRITESTAPVSGGTLAAELGVSRQIIVKDIAALKARGHEIISTTKGYLIHSAPLPERVFKVVHRDDEIGRELHAITDAGGQVLDVFVWHKIYGKIEAELNIKTYDDVEKYLATLKSGRSGPLKNVTNGYHYHTVRAKSEDTLDKVGAVLADLGFLVCDEEV